MTKIVIVGEAYYSDLRPDQGLPPGSPGYPSHPWVPPGNYPDQGLPPGSPGVPSHPIVLPGTPPGQPGSPSHPIYIVGLPPRPTHPIYITGGTPSHPIYVPVYPDQGLPPGSPGAPAHPIAGVPPGFWGGSSPHPGHPIELPPGGTPIDPPAEVPPPAGHEDDLVVGVYMPGKGWEFASYDVQPDQGQPQPEPHGRGSRTG